MKLCATAAAVLSFEVVPFPHRQALDDAFLSYRAFIESVSAFPLVSRLGNSPLKERNSLNQIIKPSGRLIGESQLCRESLYTRPVAAPSQLHLQ